MLWDVFISHAHEDKRDVARPLAKLLQEHGLRVWIDETELTIGDSLRQKIDEGLSQSKFGVVILSPSFFAKKWTQNELSALWSREDTSTKVVLPIWHKINRDSVASISPLLADKLAVSTDEGLDTVVNAILKVAGGTREITAQQLNKRYSDDFKFPLDILLNTRSAIDNLSKPEVWATLLPKHDMTSKTVWMGTDEPELVMSLYNLYLPLAAYRQMSYALERSLSTFTRYSQLRFSLLESTYYALTNETQLATSGKPIEYTPRVSEWRIKRQQTPSRYWWQGLSEERFDVAMAFFIRQPTTGFPDVVNIETFSQAYLAAYNSGGRNQQDLGLLANALYGFTPRTRPVYWRLLTFWDRIYKLYIRIHENTDVVVSDIFEIFQEQSVVDFCASRIESDKTFESASETWDATTIFFKRFIMPRIESYTSTPMD